MLASPLHMQSREDCESSRMPIAPVKLHCNKKKEQVQRVLKLILQKAEPIQEFCRQAR